MSYTAGEIVDLVRRNVDKDDLLDAVQRSMYDTDNPGICIECGEEREGCEPDAREYECWSCGRKSVFGAETLLIYI